MLLFSMLFICSCNEKILHDLDEASANRRIIGLSSIGIQASKIRDSNSKWSITVRSSDLLPAISYLEKTKFVKSNVEKELAELPMLSDASERDTYAARNLAHEIEQTLDTLAGIEEARVHLRLPRTDTLSSAALTRGSGSIMLVTNALFSTNINDIAQFTASAAGIERNSIYIFESRQPKALEVVPSTKLIAGNVSLSNQSYQLAVTSLLLGILGIVILIRLKAKVRPAAIKSEVFEGAD